MNKLKIPLSNYDIIRLLNNKVKVLKYSDINQFNTIDELLYPYNATVILYKSEPTYGHWCCIFKYKNYVEFFDSYGGFPDRDQKSRINPRFLLVSNQKNNKLVQLLYHASQKYNINFNEFQFQQREKHIATCGRWCVFRLMNKHLNTYEFKDLIDKLKNNYRLNNDLLIINII